jgi:hypothetical protein
MQQTKNILLIIFLLVGLSFISCNKSLKMKTSQGECFSAEILHTPWNDAGRGNMLYLDRHTVDCGPGYILSFFGLQQLNGAQIRYNFSCIKPSSSFNDCYDATTTVSRSDAKSVNFLDQHSPQCKPGYALNKFGLRREGPDGIFYAYSCCWVHMENCTVDTIDPQDAGSHTTYYLDRLPVAAGEFRAMTGFKLNSLTGNKQSYAVASCLPGVRGNSIFRWKSTPCNDDGAGNIFYLDRHDVDCGAGHGLSQFWLRRQGATIRYDYRCIDNASISEQCHSKTTPINATGPIKTASMRYLDRHNVQCADDEVISHFRMLRNPSNLDQIYYHYNCCKARLTKCREWETPKQDCGNWTTFYLDRLNVDAEGYEVFTRFVLSGDGGCHYKVRACQPY